MTAQYPLISKSTYLNGLQCPKLLWYEYNRKDAVGRNDLMTQFIFEQGKRVGVLAQDLFPGGIKLERIPNAQKHAEQSIEALKARKPLFEAGFIHDHMYALADILDPVGDDQWDLYEVKSGTGVYEHHYHDVAFQKRTYEGAGLKIRKCYLVNVNSSYVKRGEIEPKEFFAITDVTDRAEEMMKDIDGHISEMVKLIAGKKPPEMKIGPYCKKPHDCPLRDICWEPVSEEGNIFTLYSGGKKCFELLEMGINRVADIPDAFKLSEKQRLQVFSNNKGKPFIDRPQLKKFLKKLEYPLYFLDFETIAPAIPVYDLSSPYESIPFQYSLYKIEKEGSKPQNSSYIAPGDVDPRKEILRQLKEKLGEEGSIIAYWASFEIMCIKNACDAYPEYKKWAAGIEARFVDLLEPFKNFHYYNPKQAGSASLKAVLPAITGHSYEGLEIAEGGKASIEYYRVTFDKNVDEKDRANVLASLDKYCDLDTSGMIEIVNALKAIADR